MVFKLSHQGQLHRSKTTKVFLKSVGVIWLTDPMIIWKFTLWLLITIFWWLTQWVCCFLSHQNKEAIGTQSPGLWVRLDTEQPRLIATWMLSLAFKHTYTLAWMEGRCSKLQKTQPLQRSTLLRASTEEIRWPDEDTPKSAGPHLSC